MKKFLKIILILLIIAIIVIGAILFKQASEEFAIENKDDLYEKVEQYLIDLEKPHYHLENKYDEPNENISYFKVFTDIAKLGIRRKGLETYVYVWALVESYYMQDGKIELNSGSSMPYRFTFKGNEIIDYQVPLDGSEYLKSIKKIFPVDIQVKLLNNDLVSSNKIENEVKEYYSFVNDVISNRITTIQIGKYWQIEGEKSKTVTLNKEEISTMLSILKNLNFSTQISIGIPDYFIKINTQEKENAYSFGLGLGDESFRITATDKGEATLSTKQKNELNKIIQKYFD